MSNKKTFATLPLSSLQVKEAICMRDDIIERILALSDERLQDLLTLIQQSEEASQVSEVPHRTSA